MTTEPTPAGPAYIYRATARRIIDGDTFVADVDVGFGASVAIKVRVRGVNTPEVVGDAAAAGAESAQYTTDLLSTAGQEWVRGNQATIPLSDRTPLLVHSHKDARSFDRWVCDVWLGELEYDNLADLLIKAGMGVYEGDS